MSRLPGFSLRRSQPELASGPEAIDLEMRSDVRAVEAAVELIAKQCFSGVEPCSRTTFRFRVALAEALSNAILRGNQEDWTKVVRVRAELWPECIRISVQDEGDGFDPSQIQDLSYAEALESECGRGLTIIKHLADQVEFNDRGNTIWMTLPRC